MPPRFRLGGFFTVLYVVSGVLATGLMEVSLTIDAYFFEPGAAQAPWCSGTELGRWSPRASLPLDPKVLAFTSPASPVLEPISFQ